MAYNYDALSRLASIASPAGSFGYGYVGATGLLQSTSLPNGTSTSYSYDAFERLSEMQSRDGGGGNISRYAYGYDNVTHRSGRTGEVSQVLGEAAVTRAYSYDDVDQLTGEDVTQGGAAVGSSSLAYDPMGNRKQSASTGAAGTSTTSYGTNKLNQLTSFSTTGATGATTAASTCAYDESGNLKRIDSGQDSTLYAYDDSNQLTSVEVPQQSKSLFTYDGVKRLRISRDFAWQNGAWAQTGEVRRVYDGMDIVQERDAQNQVLATYTRSVNIGGVLSRTDQNGSLFYHYDGRGNVTQLSDGQGAVQARYAYDAFGNTSASGPAASLNRFRFSTKEQIGNLYSYGHRFYSPSTGRWINRDPIREWGGLNLYGFVGNNPPLFVDTYGESPQLAVGGAIIGAIGGGLGSLLGGGDGTAIGCSIFAGALAGAIAGFLAELSLEIPNAGAIIGAINGALTQSCIEIMAALQCGVPFNMGSVVRIMGAAVLWAVVGAWADGPGIREPLTNFMFNLDLSFITNRFGPAVGGGCPNSKGVLY